MARSIWVVCEGGGGSGGHPCFVDFFRLFLFLSFEPEKALNLLYVYHCFLPCVLCHDNRSEKVRIHRSLERRRGSLQRTDEFFCLNFVFPRLCLDNAFAFLCTDLLLFSSNRDKSKGQRTFLTLSSKGGRLPLQIRLPFFAMTRKSSFRLIDGTTPCAG